MKDQIRQELEVLRDLGWLRETHLADIMDRFAGENKSLLAYLLEIGELDRSQYEDALERLGSDETEQTQKFQAESQELEDSEVTRVREPRIIFSEGKTEALTEHEDKGTDDLALARMAIDRNRFHILGKLGKGGMGIVYRAYDYQLERNVAIKVLISRDPESMARFIREARAQASVDHEHICKVYEVGQTGDQPYIVMQYIEGEKLDVACQSMTLEQQLLVMKQIAYGVHEAHRMGLIHRDLKPANVMVMTTEEGRNRPFVLDFGLARFGFNPDMTMVGEIVGTPAFMAPEQALGLHAQLDRRTDVYALGATMYRILTGMPPVRGESGGEVLANLQTTDPLPPRKILRQIPKDVEIIIMKCLERKPEDRYASARALADDLGHFLDGDPIQAQPPGIMYRLRKKILKYRAISGMAAVVLLLLIMFAAALVRSRWQIAERERLATVFTERVEEVDAISRNTYLARRHDIRHARAKLENTMAAIRGDMKQTGSVGEGLGNYALGRASFLLGDAVAAQTYLQNAWDSGYRTPRVAYALGLALGEHYRNGLEGVQLLPNRVDRDRRKSELQTLYLDRARALIQEGAEEETENPAYFQALLAYYDQRLEAALTYLDDRKDVPAWFYEADKLRGDIHRDRAVSLSESGETQLAKVEFEKALDAYQRARETGESDPRNYRSRGIAFLQMLMMGIFTKENMDPVLKQGLQEVYWALEVVPDDWGTWHLKAKLHRYMAQQLLLSAQDPIHQLNLAEEAARCALHYGGEESQIRMELGDIYWRVAQWEEERRIPNTESTQLALSNLERVAEKDKTFNYFHTLGTIEMTQANVLVRSGEDAKAAYSNAISAFSKAIELAPDQFGIYNSMAICLFRLSEQSGLDETPMALLQQSVDALQMAILINPNHVVLHYQLGRTYFQMAQKGRPLVGDLDENLAEKALQHYQHALEINPRMIQLYNVLGMVYYFRGIYAWEEGMDAGPWFEKAQETYEQGLALGPNARRLHQNLSWVFYYQGKILLRKGENPSTFFNAAEKSLRLAMAEGTDVEALLCQASIHRLKAEWSQAQPGPFKLHFEKAEEGFLQILAMNPNYAEAHRSLGRLFTLAGMRQIIQGQGETEWLEKGRKALDEALALEPESPYIYLADARWYIAEALSLRSRSHPADTPIDQGSKSVTKALKLRPKFLEAELANSALVWLKQDISSPEGVPAKALPSMFNKNPSLAREWLGMMTVLKRP